MKNGSCSFRQKTFMPVRLGGATKRFDIDERSGVVKNLKLSSDDESVLVIREDSAGHTNLIFLAGGEVGLTASVSDDISITEFFDVVELEFSRGTNADEILTAFGQPTDRKQHVFEWPASGSIDGISYVPTINQKTLSAEHWHFRDRPGLVVSIVNDRLYNVGAKSD